MISTKVSLFALRFLNNHFQTKDNLMRCGIISPDLSFYINGCDLKENWSHLFFLWAIGHWDGRHQNHVITILATMALLSLFFVLLQKLWGFWYIWDLSIIKLLDIIQNRSCFIKKFKRGKMPIPYSFRGWIDDLLDFKLWLKLSKKSWIKIINAGRDHNNKFRHCDDNYGC